MIFERAVASKDKFKVCYIVLVYCGLAKFILIFEHASQMCRDGLAKFILIFERASRMHHDGTFK